MRWLIVLVDETICHLTHVQIFSGCTRLHRVIFTAGHHGLLILVHILALRLQDDLEEQELHQNGKVEDQDTSRANNPWQLCLSQIYNINQH